MGDTGQRPGPETEARCVCGLKAECPYHSTTLDCPFYRDHVQPTWYERIIGFFAAIFGGRW